MTTDHGWPTENDESWQTLPSADFCRSVLQLIATGRHVVNGSLSPKCSLCDFEIPAGGTPVLRVWLSEMEPLAVIARVCARCSVAGRDPCLSDQAATMTVPL